VRRRAVAYTQGHGTSVLTEEQYKVLLGFRRYGGVGEQYQPAVRDVPASLEDILPTILQALSLPAAPLADGLSLLPVLQGESNAEQTLSQRIRFTETDFNVPRMLAGDINVKWLAMQSIEYYRVDPQTGWVEFRREKLPEMMALKERAAIQGDWLLAALPGAKGSTYVLVNRKTRMARLSPDLDSAQTDSSAAPLLTALLERYAGYLVAPSRNDLTSGT